MKKKFKIKKRRLLIILLMAIILLIPVGITFSKYVKKFINYYVLESNNFFFNSDKLGEDTIYYNVNNWGGVGSFDIQFELNNHKNNLLTSDSDITYNITLDYSDNLNVSINKSSGTIYCEDLSENFTINVTPTASLDEGDSVYVRVTAQATSPYEKTLSAVFTYTVGKKGLNYEIIDEENSPYLNFSITNALDQYTVQTAFDSYSVGDVISINTYKSLSADNQEKCYSALITLTFDPNDILLDITSNIVDNATTTNTIIDGVAYVSSITFKIDALTGSQIRFYKQDVTEDYTYPFDTNTPIITFSARTEED